MGGGGGRGVRKRIYFRRGNGGGVFVCLGGGGVYMGGGGQGWFVHANSTCRFVSFTANTYLGCTCCWHPFSFSSYHPTYRISPCRIRLFSSSLPLTPFVPPCTVQTLSNNVGSTLACVAARADPCAFFLLHRTTGIPLPSVWWAQMHSENAVSAFSHSPLGRARRGEAGVSRSLQR